MCMPTLHLNQTLNFLRKEARRKGAAMEAMVDDQGTVVVSQSGSIESSSQRNSGATHQVVTTASGQTIAVPTGAVSIVHLALPNQQPMVQSVIQQNQQSVIQTTSGASHLQAVQLPKGGVILLNKAGSVIQPTAGGHIQTLQRGGSRFCYQVTSLSEAEEMAVAAEEESKKRREILARRPSYRKILNDLSSADSPAISSDVKEESSMSESSNDGDSMNTITVAGITDGSLKGGDPEYIVVPAGAIQMATGSQGETIQGLQTLTMANSGSGGAGTIVQYAQGQDGQFFVPVTVSAADLQAYQIRATGGNGNQGVVVTPNTNLHSPQQIAEDASRKRELRLLKNRSRTQSRVQPDSCYSAENGSNSQVNIRLLKNREAARECRRKKKEYIKCLENRVAVLENQNKALIEELKSLKELYCQKND